MNEETKSIVLEKINSMTNESAKSMLSNSIENDKTLDDVFLSLRVGVVVASISLEDTDINKVNKSTAIISVTNDSDRSMTTESLKEDISVAIDYINKNYVEGAVKWEE